MIVLYGLVAESQDGRLLRHPVRQTIPVPLHYRLR
jgi:hypothetical protein